LDRLHSDSNHLRRAAGLHAIEHGIAETARVFHKKLHWVEYWKEKVSNPAFHPNTHGGAHHFKFNQDELEILWTVLWTQCQQKPTSRIEESVLLNIFFFLFRLFSFRFGNNFEETIFFSLLIEFFFPFPSDMFVLQENTDL